MRKIFAATTALVLAFTLSGCSHSSIDMYDAFKAQCGEVKTSANADKVVVSDVSGSKVPKVSFAPGLKTEKLETILVKEGTGPKITGSQKVTFSLQSLNGTTGKVLANSKFDGSDAVSEYFAPPTDASTENLCTSLGGVREGSRVVILIPAAYTGTPDSAVLLLDINKVYLPYASGDKVGNIESGLPNVVRDPISGRPSVQWTSAAAPTELKSVAVIKGWGETVNANSGQTVTMHYRLWTWGSLAEADSSWTRAQPFETDLSTGSVIEGWIKGLDGVTVGSQILLVVPPALGYGDKAQGDAIPANSTLVFVVDVLGVTGTK